MSFVTHCTAQFHKPANDQVVVLLKAYKYNPEWKSDFDYSKQRRFHITDKQRHAMVRWALGVTRKDKIRNEYVRGSAKIAKLGDKLRNARLRWYGHVKRREEGYVGKTMMEMAVPGRRKRGRPRRRWMDLAREDMERAGAKEGDEVDRQKWRILSRCGDPE